MCKSHSLTCRSHYSVRGDDPVKRIGSFLDLGLYLGDPRVVASLIGEFLGVEATKSGPEIAASAKRLASIFAGRDPGYARVSAAWNPTRLAAHIVEEIPAIDQWDKEPEAIIANFLAVAAMIARGLAQEKNDSFDRFAQDVYRLFVGLPMQRKWIVVKPAKTA